MHLLRPIRCDSAIPLRPWRQGLLLLACCACVVSNADAQDSSSRPAAASRSASSGSEATPSGSKATPGGSEKPGASQEAEGKKPDEQKQDSPKVIERPTEPSTPPDPQELTVRPADDGKLAFNFRNQPWIALLEWFAEIADQPLDWRQLPGDHVNLASSGRYTLDEVFDLLNRHLLARGFTMVQLDDGLMVLKTEGINPALVPRVDAAALASLQPHQFVRTSLDAGWLSAEELAEELKPMISSNGRLVALKSTNRIEAMDAATNLLQVSELLQQELSSDARSQLAPEFELRYISAADAKEMLQQFLGIKEEDATPLTPQQIQQMQQMRSRGGNNGQQPPTEEKEPEISIVANPRRNSVIIQAPAARLAIAREFIKRIDVPSDSIVSLADVESRVEAFRLVSLDPEKLIEIVQDMNILEPSTHIRVDTDHRAVIVSGSAADRFIIKSLIERLDGSGREFYVLPIRYRDPRAVAESISFLMGKNKDDEDSGRNRRYYGYFGYGGQEEESKQQDEFRVTADVRFQQVLLWANQMEMNEVRGLLVKLGEIPPEEGSRRAVRVIDASPTPETYQYLQRLKEQFQQISPNEVELPPMELFKQPSRRPHQDDTKADAPDRIIEDNGSGADGAEQKAEDEDDAETSDEDPLARRPARRGLFLTAAMQSADGTSTQQGARPAQESADVDPAEINPGAIRSAEDFDRLFGTRNAGAPRAEDDSAASSRKDSEAAPLQITVDGDGRIVVRSEDTKALDRLEALMLQVTPPKRSYEIFYIEHASAYWIQLNLEEYFSDEEEEEETSGTRYYFYDYNREDESDQPAGLDQERKMRMISDDDTNSIVVTGATPEQLRTIKELIEIWDVPPPVDRRKARYTKLVPVRYSRAEEIAETVKEAYRDLLSSNDKTFAQGNRGGGGGGGRNTQRNGAERNRGGDGAELVDGGESGQSGGSDFDFKGKLAIGVDKVGNTLLVSAEGEDLLNLVVGMIEQLDTAARPQEDLQVHQVTGTINPLALEAALRVLGAGGSTPVAAQPSAAPSPDSPAGERGGERGGRRNGRQADFGGGR